MDPSVFLETGIVLAPQSIDSIGFTNYRFDHLRLVMREIIGDVKHHVADQIPDGG